jgi:hypothetical protein
MKIKKNIFLIYLMMIYYNLFTTNIKVIHSSSSLKEEELSNIEVNLISKSKTLTERKDIIDLLVHVIFSLHINYYDDDNYTISYSDLKNSSLLRTQEEKEKSRKKYEYLEKYENLTSTERYLFNFWANMDRSVFEYKQTEQFRQSIITWDIFAKKFYIIESIFKSIDKEKGPKVFGIFKKMLEKIESRAKLIDIDKNDEKYKGFLELQYTERYLKYLTNNIQSFVKDKSSHNNILLQAKKIVSDKKYGSVDMILNHAKKMEYIQTRLKKILSEDEFQLFDQNFQQMINDYYSLMNKKSQISQDRSLLQSLYSTNDNSEISNKEIQIIIIKFLEYLRTNRKNNTIIPINGSIKISLDDQKDRDIMMTLDDKKDEDVIKIQPSMEKSFDSKSLKKKSNGKLSGTLLVGGILSTSPITKNIKVLSNKILSNKKQT